MKKKLTHAVVMLDGVDTPVLVTIGLSGWSPIIGGNKKRLKDLDMGVAERYNTRTPSEPERKAALHGAIFGWDAKGANPDYWDTSVG